MIKMSNGREEEKSGGEAGKRRANGKRGKKRGTCPPTPKKKESKIRKSEWEEKKEQVSEREKWEISLRKPAKHGRF